MSSDPSVPTGSAVAESPATFPDALTSSIDAMSAKVDEELAAVERQRDQLLELSAIVADVRVLTPSVEPSSAVATRLTEEETSTAIERLAALGGTVRSVTMTLAAGPATEEALVRQGQGLLREGTIRLLQIYGADLLAEPGARRWLRSWAAVGEVQRVHASPPSEFIVFNDQAVVALAEWGQTQSGSVLIRDPQIVAVYSALFDATFAQSLPIPDLAKTSQEVDDRIIELMGFGMKDESIARHLDIGLRTVRRRIGRIMDARGVQTRYQLGASVAAESRLPAAWTEALGARRGG